MKAKALFVAAAGLMIQSVVTLGQGRGTPPPPATDTVAPDIPGVVAGGTRVHVIKEGFNGSEGTITLPDGSVIFSETTASRTIKIDTDDRVSTFLENTNGSNGMFFDKARPEIEKLSSGEGAFNGKSTTNVKFGETGDYVLHVTVNYYSGDGGGGFGCCWTTGLLKVTVK